MILKSSRVGHGHPQQATVIGRRNTPRCLSGRNPPSSYVNAGLANCRQPSLTSLNEPSGAPQPHETSRAPSGGAARCLPIAMWSPLVATKARNGLGGEDSHPRRAHQPRRRSVSVASGLHLVRRGKPARGRGRGIRDSSGVYGEREHAVEALGDVPRGACAQCRLTEHVLRDRGWPLARSSYET